MTPWNPGGRSGTVYKGMECDSSQCKSVVVMGTDFGDRFSPLKYPQGGIGWGTMRVNDVTKCNQDADIIGALIGPQNSSNGTTSSPIETPIAHSKFSLTNSLLQFWPHGDLQVSYTIDVKLSGQFFLKGTFKPRGFKHKIHASAARPFVHGTYTISYSRNGEGLEPNITCPGVPYEFAAQAVATKAPAGGGGGGR